MDKIYQKKAELLVATHPLLGLLSYEDRSLKMEESLALYPSTRLVEFEANFERFSYLLLEFCI